VLSYFNDIYANRYIFDEKQILDLTAFLFHLIM